MNQVAAVQISGKQIAKEAGGTNVATFFEQNRSAIEAVLPQHMTPDRMMKIALRALRTTPKLMQCTISSLFGAVITCAQLGLEPNTPQGHIFLIPFENKRKNATEVQVIIGYKGLIDLARRSGEIVSISSHAVREGDAFEVFFGTDESISHKPNLTGELGKIIGFYATAKLVGGGTQFEFMRLSEVNAIRDGSQGYKAAVAMATKYKKDVNSPWVTNFEEMGRKTAIRRLCKYLPMSVELAGAVALENRHEHGEGQNLDGVLEGDFHIVADTDDVVEAGADEPEDIPDRPKRSDHKNGASSLKSEPALTFEFTGYDGEFRDGLTAQQFADTFCDALNEAGASEIADGIWETNSPQMQALRDLGPEGVKLADLIDVAYDGALTRLKIDPQDAEPKQTQPTFTPNPEWVKNLPGFFERGNYSLAKVGIDGMYLVPCLIAAIKAAPNEKVLNKLWADNGCDRLDPESYDAVSGVMQDRRDQLAGE